MIAVLVPYRARGVQTFRRAQLAQMIENCTLYFEKNEVSFKIFIVEQNDDRNFNRGLLLNVAFVRALRSKERGDDEEDATRYRYMHMNVDYNFDLARAFPRELFARRGFVELYRPFEYPVLGSACSFDEEAYRRVNGFPNDLWG